MAFRPANLTSGALAGLAGFAGNTQQFRMSPATCPCGAAHTKTFANPRGVSVSNTEAVAVLTMCDACDFRFTVMRAAGRVEEFLSEYAEKAARAEERELQIQEEIRQNRQKMYETQMAHSQKSYQSLQGWQDSTNVYRKLFGQGSPAPCTETVQSPDKLKPWYKKILGMK